MSRKRKTDAVPAVDAEQATIVAYKGFSENWTCQGMQYAVGETFRHDGRLVCCPTADDIAAGAGGLHACEHPLDIFNYYPPATSRFAVVETKGAVARQRDSSDTKIAAAEITIKAELRLPELIAAAVRYVTDRVKWIDGRQATADQEGVRCTEAGAAATASGWWGAATASGYQGAATASGDRGAATASGDRGAATASGDQGAATASGYQGAATASGRQGAATASGRRGAATASGDGGAATASGDWGAATASGYQGAATASGDWGAATASGDQGAATASGEQGAATATGIDGKVRGAEGCALFLVERDRDDGTILHAWAGIAGRNGIKPDTFYQLRDGKPVEVGQDD